MHSSSLPDVSRWSDARVIDFLVGDDDHPQNPTLRTMVAEEAARRKLGEAIDARVLEQN